MPPVFAREGILGNDIDHWNWFYFAVCCECII